MIRVHSGSIARCVAWTALALVTQTAAVFAQDARWLARDGSPLPFTTDEEVLEFLSNAEIVTIERIPTGVTEPKRVILERDGVTVRAAFHYHHIVKDKQRMAGGSFIEFFRDSYVNQVAAYEVGRLLGLENHPPTVLREVEGQQGSVQLWIENGLIEGQRRNDAIKFPDIERARRQVADMDVFDALINNLDRTQGNFLWRKDNWDLWLIDHTRALGRNRGLYEPQRLSRCSRSLWTSLNDLDKGALKKALAPYLSRKEIAAVLARRKAIVDLFEKRIAELGESEVLF